MRKGFNGSIWRSEDGKLIAINLGADHCGEHECGISNIQYRAKMDLTALGLEKRKVNVDPFSKEENLIHTNLDLKPARVLREIFEEGKPPVRTYTKWYGLLFDRLYNRTLDASWWKEKVAHTRIKDTVVGHWDDDSFCVLTQDRSDIEDLLEAFRRRDIGIWIGSRSGPFSNGGLIVAIASRLPAENVMEMLSIDLDRKELLEAAERTGIKERLDSAKKQYFALSPDWSNDEKREVIFWLNPIHQNIYNAGWMTVRDLEDWINDKGKVLKPQTAK